MEIVWKKTGAQKKAVCGRHVTKYLYQYSVVERRDFTPEHICFNPQCNAIPKFVIARAGWEFRP